jgi:hypothetical protein
LLGGLLLLAPDLESRTAKTHLSLARSRPRFSHTTTNVWKQFVGLNKTCPFTHVDHSTLSSLPDDSTMPEGYGTGIGEVSRPLDEKCATAVEKRQGVVVCVKVHLRRGRARYLTWTSCLESPDWPCRVQRQRCQLCAVPPQGEEISEVGVEDRDSKQPQAPNTRRIVARRQHSFDGSPGQGA